MEQGVQSRGVSANGKEQRRVLWLGVGMLATIVLVGAAHAPILREIASFLIVEDSLRPAAAIVALGGGTPFRETEAATLYRAGWAPFVVIVRGVRREEAKALQDLRIEVKEGWELSREVLIRQGVPPSAILVPEEEAEGTLEESQAAFRGLKPENRPVILVTSKFHTRRVRLTWNYVSNGRSQAIVRAAGQDPFDPTRWWRERRFVLSVVREYLGLINYYAGFPVTP
jgi:uncharacterized SAM-binding protein YcdF (DUF218 family)